MEQLAPAEKFRLTNLGAVAGVRASAAAILLGVSIVNNQAAAIFVQLFDVATAGAVTLGTTVPDYEFTVAANSSLVPQLPPAGVKFRFGLQAASTTLEGGSVASAAGVQVFVLLQ